MKTWGSWASSPEFRPEFTLSPPFPSLRTFGGPRRPIWVTLENQIPPSGVIQWKLYDPAQGSEERAMRRGIKIRWGALLTVGFMGGSLAAQEQAPKRPDPPRWTFSSRSVALSGLTPDGKFAWFSVGRESYDYGVSIRLQSGLALDADNDGREQIEIERALSPASIWGAVDFQTGTFALARPSGEPIDPVSIHGNPRAALHKIDFDDRDYLYVFLVRPKTGAWWARVGDGGPDDEDGTSDHRIGLLLSALRPFEGSPPPPERIDRDDLVFAIDPNRLDAFAAGVRE